jgi:hypothetical protein
MEDLTKLPLLHGMAFEAALKSKAENAEYAENLLKEPGKRFRAVSIEALQSHVVSVASFYKPISKILSSDETTL